MQLKLWALTSAQNWPTRSHLPVLLNESLLSPQSRRPLGKGGRGRNILQKYTKKVHPSQGEKNDLWLIILRRCFRRLSTEFYVRMMVHNCVSAWRRRWVCLSVCKRGWMIETCFPRICCSTEKLEKRGGYSCYLWAQRERERLRQRQIERETWGGYRWALTHYCSKVHVFSEWRHRHRPLSFHLRVR